MKLAKGWKEEAYSFGFCKRFGPLKAVLYREWPMTARQPIGFVLTFEGTDVTATLTFETLGCDWFADEAEALATRAADKRAKELIRSWAK